MSGHTPVAARSSLRFRLALTYAGIALLTVAVLGAVLVAVLSHYFGQAEDRYLQAVAARANMELARGGTTPDEIARGASILALTSQTRVRVYDASDELVADSGLSADIDPETLAPPFATPGERDRLERRRLPSPLGAGIFGAADSTRRPRSERVLRLPLVSANGAPAGYLLLSDGPASGRDVLASVAQGLGIAAFVAVLLAALAGYLLSSRISRPIVELTRASDLMADGDLSARAGITRDDEVGRLASSFDTMADRIEATVVTLRRFVADAAHEIGTPLTALQADLELAENATAENDERMFVRRALGQARRIEELSANLLRLSRIEAGESPVVLAPVDLSRLVREAADGAASRAEQVGVNISATVPPLPVVVSGDEAKLQVVVENLVDNALKFTPESGSIELGVEARGDSAVLWVADTGIGIPDAEHADVFGRFYRARNVAAYPGSGLGLAIVLATTEAHGGTVGFRSDSSGTRFEVHLPQG